MRASVLQSVRVVAVVVAVVWPALGAAQQLTTEDDAAGGCDGVKNGRWGFHTDRDEPAWWQVDLGRSVVIERVVVFNRCDPIGDRAAHLMLLLSDGGRSWQTMYRHDGTPFRGVTDARPLVIGLDAAPARFVRIQLPRAGYLHLDEVEVYGTENPGVNLALHRPADQSSTSPWSTDHPGVAVNPTLEEVLENGLRLAADLGASGVDVDRHESSLRRLFLAIRSTPVSQRGGAGRAGAPDHP